MSTATEFVNITETRDHQLVVVLNEERLGMYMEDENEFKGILDSFFTLAGDYLQKDLKKSNKKETIKVSLDPAHTDTVMVLRFLLNDDGKFYLITHFGGAAIPYTPIREALKHAIEVVEILKREYS